MKTNTVHGMHLTEKEAAVRYYLDPFRCAVICSAPNKGIGMFQRQDNGGLYNSLAIACLVSTGNILQITEKALPYLKKPKGKFAEFSEFRLVTREDSFLLVPDDSQLLKGNGHVHVNGMPYESRADHMLSGYRWCKPPKVEPIFVDCPVLLSNSDQYVVELCNIGNQHTSRLLACVPGIKGYYGTHFEGQQDGIWSRGITNYIHRDGHRVPAKPLMVRFCVEDI